LPALLCVLAWGCPIRVNVPINRFDSPETRGRFGKVHGDFGVQGTSKLTVVPDYTASPPVTNSRSFTDTSGGVRLAFGMGLMRRMDLDVKLPLPGPGTIQLKYQLLGAPESEAARGNTSLAITAAVGSEVTSGGNARSDGTYSSQDTYDHRGSYFDVAAILGRRLFDSVMVYGGPFRTAVGYDGTIDQAGGQKYSYSGATLQRGVNLGLQVAHRRAVVRLESALSLATDGSARRSGFTGGFVLGYRW
jgi:hypothetical protein